jgi:hypothetical protein
MAMMTKADFARHFAETQAVIARGGPAPKPASPPAPPRARPAAAPAYVPDAATLAAVEITKMSLAATGGLDFAILALGQRMSVAEARQALAGEVWRELLTQAQAEH